MNDQVTLTVARDQMQRVIEQYDKQNYLLIHTEVVSNNRLTLTFDKYSGSALVHPKEPLKPIKAIKLNSSDEIPDHLLDEVFK